MQLNELEKIRLEKIEKLKQLGIDPYPTRTEVTHSVKQALELFAEFEKSKDESAPAPQVTIGGRIRSKRSMGKLGFSHVEDGSGSIQLMLRVNELGQEKVDQFNDLYDLGDFLQASGELIRSRTGEVTLLVNSYKMLAKALTPLPPAKDEEVDGKVVRHATLTDPETRYRERYADLAVNPQVRDIFQTRSKIIRALQEYLDDQGFIEVETPILQPIYGGAAAKPFITHHNQLKQDLYLRISFELYLKRLLVGGLERVYEIGRDFRNEGVSFKHNPEFTQLEFYMAYADYLKIMEMTENMIAFVCDRVIGSRTVVFDGKEINFNIPWKRLELRQAILEKTGIDIQLHPDETSLFKAMQEANLNPKPGAPRGKLIDAIIGDLIEPNIIQPTILFNYPRDISPLAKNLPGDTATVERFEGFVGGVELCNAFTELNDPLEQEKRFLEMGRDYDKDDEERHPMDEDYLRAMSYGMPPCGGFGMGLDRLTMLLTNNHSIREVILFPPLRKEEES